MKAECSKMMVQFWKALLLLFFSVTFFSFSVPFSCFSVFLLSLFLSLSPLFSLVFSPFFFLLSSLFSFLCFLSPVLSSSPAFSPLIFFCSPHCFLFFVFCPLFSPLLRSLLPFLVVLLGIYRGFSVTSAHVSFPDKHGVGGVGFLQGLGRQESCHGRTVGGRLRPGLQRRVRRGSLIGLGTLADQNQSALACVELPMWAAFQVFFFFTGSSLCFQRKKDDEWK